MSDIHHHPDPLAAAVPSAVTLHTIHIECRGLAGDMAAEDTPLRLRKGRITAVAADSLSCTVDLGNSGSSVPGVRVLAPYVPGVGHYVYVLIDGPLWIVLGRQP